MGFGILGTREQEKDVLNGRGSCAVCAFDGARPSSARYRG